MAVRLRDGEVYFAEEGTLNRSQLLMFFLNENIDSLVVVYDRSEKYQGAICYQSLLQPTAIIAKTIKGKDVSFMENQASWHGNAPNDEQYAVAMSDLEKVGEALCQM